MVQPLEQLLKKEQKSPQKNKLETVTFNLNNRPARYLNGSD